MSQIRFCSLRSVLLGTVAGLLGASSALAQAAQQPGPAQDDQAAVSVGEVVVTASRIDRAGYEAPTPLTVVTATDLQVGQRSNLGAALTDFPAFRATTSPTVQATGMNSSTTPADLRGLGSTRTLVLVDGHRFIGDTDLNSVPFALINRVDVLTGGASAAWGSGAVAGVVNIILNDKIYGGRFSAQVGASTEGDGEEYRASAAHGWQFAQGRGNLMVAGEYVKNEGIFTKLSREYVSRYSVFTNPSYTPGGDQHQFTILPNVNYSNASEGGLIVSGVLSGQTFNTDGTLRPFQYGLVSGALQQGGEGVNNADYSPLSPPLTRYNLSGAANYELSDNVTLYGNVMFSRVDGDYGFYPESNRGNLTIRSDNAFLPDTIKQQLSAAGQDSFLLGRMHADFGLIHLNYRHDTLSTIVGAKGDLGDRWRWDAYYSHGEFQWDTTLSNIRIANNFSNAVDAVISPTSGLPVCRVTLTNANSGCVPINLFGSGSPSQAALDYVLGAQTEYLHQSLDVGGISIRGEPFALPAGDVSVAFGVEARREKLDATVTPLAASRAFSLINFGARSGSFDVREVFGEVIVPIVKDVPLFKLLEFNGGYRVSDYSNSGDISSWKLGLTNRVTDDFRVRGVVSRDIRSASLSELFQTPLPTFATLYDPVKNTQLTVATFGGGNADLNPETADTFTVGAVYSPSWAPGFNISVDYYDISVDNVITSLGGQDIINRCAAGNTALCAKVIRDSSGSLTEVVSGNLNLANYETSGFDIEASYQFPLDRISDTLPGSVRLKVLATNIQGLESDDGVTRVNYLGSLAGLGQPKWRGLASATYISGGLNVDLRARYVGSALYDRNMDISNNEISAHVEFDLGAEYELGAWNGNSVTVFGSVKNLFDSHPPAAAPAVHYDLVGRYVTAGVRARF